MKNSVFSVVLFRLKNYLKTKKGKPIITFKLEYSLQKIVHLPFEN